MASARDILRRIKSVKNIGQVTRAMEAVSASKMRKAQERTLASRAYAVKAREVLSFLAAQPGAEGAHSLLQERENVRRVALILITPDRGLAGALISNILRVAMRFIQQNQDKEIVVVTVGKKGRDFMVRYGPRLLASFPNPGDKVSSADASAISQVAMDGFLGGEFDAVYLLYVEFISMLSQHPTVLQLLPLKPEIGGTGGLSAEYLIEPSPEAVLESLLPTLVDMQVYQALLESLSSEHSARMVAMRAATDNAKQLVEDLRLTYNKARQSAITSEILDIAGGAEALAQTMAE
ncbi:MAG: ATP synthase F1 subunit gamma [Ardenticatenales bacterium]|nr:ATP synthase F1 subunit gamma [Ardenticatenales bacterium]